MLSQEQIDAGWVEVTGVDDLEEDDAISVEMGGHVYAVYRTETGLYATDGICTHQYAHLSKGFVMDDVIECPIHQGRFHIPSGKALSSPACVKLNVYEVRQENGRVFLRATAKAA